jgi:hypothetical protein
LDEAGACHAIGVSFPEINTVDAFNFDFDPARKKMRARYLDAAQAKLAFQVISERNDFRRSTCVTTNRPFKDWTKVFPDALNAQVVAERLTERSEHFVLEKSFRMAKS